MVDFLFIAGEVMTILALVGLIGVLIWTAMTALKLKTSVMTNAGRLYKRPLAAGKNLATTVKGIAQQEAVRGKHIGASAKVAVGAVQDAATHIKDTAGSVHPENLKPALASLSNITKVLKVAAKLSQASSHQGTHSA
ncbi:MAG: hypothetical protein ACRYFS_12615 [Janthinobacterium lividum]